MTPSGFLASVTEGVGALAVVLGLCIVVYLVWKRALLDMQEKAMKVQGDVIKAYEDRIKQLEDQVECGNTERDDMRRDIAALRSEIKGSRDLAIAIVETIGESRICLSAPGCDNRVVPTV